MLTRDRIPSPLAISRIHTIEMAAHARARGISLSEFLDERLRSYTASVPDGLADQVKVVGHRAVRMPGNGPVVALPDAADPIERAQEALARVDPGRAAHALDRSRGLKQEISAIEQDIAEEERYAAVLLGDAGLLAAGAQPEGVPASTPPEQALPRRHAWTATGRFVAAVFLIVAEFFLVLTPLADQLGLDASHLAAEIARDPVIAGYCLALSISLMVGSIALGHLVLRGLRHRAKVSMVANAAVLAGLSSGLAWMRHGLVLSTGGWGLSLWWWGVTFAAPIFVAHLLARKSLATTDAVPSSETMHQPAASSVAEPSPDERVAQTARAEQARAEQRVRLRLSGFRARRAKLDAELQQEVSRIQGVADAITAQLAAENAAKDRYLDSVCSQLEADSEAWRDLDSAGCRPLHPITAGVATPPVAQAGSATTVFLCEGDHARS